MHKNSRLNFLIIMLVYIMPIPMSYAVQPDEILQDPVLEQRARDISAQLRCLVCQNESIDESNADLAKTLRLLVRERLVVGDSNEQVFDYLVDRYGEFILLKPVFGLHTLLLWLSGPLIFIIGIFISLRNFRHRTYNSENADIANASLSQDEEKRLKDILKDDIK